jgi:hypothetical protein
MACTSTRGSSVFPKGLNWEVSTLGHGLWLARKRSTHSAQFVTHWSVHRSNASPWFRPRLCHLLPCWIPQLRRECNGQNLKAKVEYSGESDTVGLCAYVLLILADAYAQQNISLTAPSATGSYSFDAVKTCYHLLDHSFQLAVAACCRR